MRQREAFPGVIVCAGFLAVSAFSDGALAAPPKESVLYRFNGGSDGAAPMASMIADSSGNLYGTTSEGGGSANCTSGCGTVFELSPPAERGGGWTETVLYSFQGGNDGATPEAPMVADKSGNLYGVTSAGGGDCANANMASCGTVFELIRPGQSGDAWTETLLYSFLGNPDGKGTGDLAWPNGLRFDAAGDLYGLAYSGGYCQTNQTGTYCYGGAFSLTLQGGAWTENVIYRFKGQSGDPAGPVLDGAGRLYGTAPGGAYGCGGVFRLTAPKGQGEWKVSALYDFQCGNDGAFPVPGLVFDAAGNLYDMSLGSGSGYGNVFELTPTKGSGWSENVLYNFIDVADGYTPSVGPILGPNGRLYGTTEEGGESDEGAAFELTPPRNHGDAWTEHVLHSFARDRGGFAPYGGLTLGKNNAIYGTTPVGGGTACGNGCGTIFEVVP
jgi:uncharacterized repeat protein (TIGR03803 family)